MLRPLFFVPKKGDGMKKIEQHIERLWKIVYSSGIGDIQRGLNVISYLFLLKALEDRDTIAVDGEYRWSTIKQLASTNEKECSQHLYTRVGPWLASRDPESCLAYAPFAFSQIFPHLIYRIMDVIDTMCFHPDAMSEVFEAVIAYAGVEGAFSQKAGQIMTPPHIARLMADLAQPQPGERIMDTHCGTGNLLVAACQYDQKSTQHSSWLLVDGRVIGAPERAVPALMPIGYDFNLDILPPCYTHLFLCGVDLPQVCCSDSLGTAFNQRITEGTLKHVNVILGNPPFSGFRDESDLGETLCWLGTQNTELLFVDLTIQCLCDGGRGILLLPEGVFRNTSQAALSLRKKLLVENQVRGIVSLPPGIFMPQANVKTSLLLFTKGGCTTDDIWFYRVEDDGFSLNAKRQATPTTSNLWDVRMQYTAICGLTSPVSVPGLLNESWWEQYASAQSYPPTMYVAPIIEEMAANQVTGEMVYRVTGFAEEATTRERSWFISPKEIEANGYSLCADTYREHIDERKRTGQWRKTQ